MQQRLSILTLGVKDLAASRKFYAEELGWKELEPKEENIAFFQLNGLRFALFLNEELAKDSNTPKQNIGGFTMAYNLNSKQEVDELFTELIDKNVSIAKTPQEVFWGGYSGYFYGPDRELWEVAFNPFTAVCADGTFGEDKPPC